MTRTLIPKLQLMALVIIMVASFVIPQSGLAQNVPLNANRDDCGDFQAQGPLCIPKSPFNNSNSLANTTSATELIGRVIKIMLYFAGMLAVLFVVIGGYYYLTARGNEEQATTGRKTLMYALLGLVIVIFSFVIVNVVTNQLTNGSV